MKIFIDSADLTEIKKYMSWGICDGVTTNPTICLKCGVIGGMPAIKQRTIEIAQLIQPAIVSVEATSENPEEILSQARDFKTWADNLAVKVTITDKNGNSLLPVIHQLVSEGTRVNVTAMTTFNQAILAAKAIKSAMVKSETQKTPHFISVFGGRISEEHGVEQATRVLENLRKWLDFHNYQGIEIIVGSVRSPENVELWAKSGAHILTIPPDALSKCLSSARTKETVAQFISDAEKAIKEIGS